MHNLPHALLTKFLLEKCGSNVFQDYFDDAKDSSLESRVKQVPRIKESFNQSKFQESKSHSIKTRSIKNQDSSKKNQEKTQLR